LADRLCRRTSCPCARCSGCSSAAFEMMTLTVSGLTSQAPPLGCRVACQSDGLQYWGQVLVTYLLHTVQATNVVEGIQSGGESSVQAEYLQGISWSVKDRTGVRFRFEAAASRPRVVPWPQCARSQTQKRQWERYRSGDCCRRRYSVAAENGQSVRGAANTQRVDGQAESRAVPR
jgi:hypothetical protein